MKKDKFENDDLLNWLASNMDVLFATEVISFLQQVLLKELILNNRENYPFIDQLCKSYMQCIRVSQNRRIESNSSVERPLEINCSLTKLFGLIFASQCEKTATKASLK